MIEQKDRGRLVLLALGIFTLFSLLIFQFFKIQILDFEKWSSVAKRQHYFVINEPFVRGIFWSNTSIKQGHPEEPQKFVFDIQKHHLYIDPYSIDEEYRDTIAEKLYTFLDLSENQEKTLREQFNRKSRSRKLEMWLDLELKEKILQWWLPFARKHKIARNALYFVIDYKRSYPFGKLLGQVLHTVQNQRDEVTKQALPTGGLELTFNERLKGKLGKRRLKRSPSHYFETGEVIDPPENGEDIHLSINHFIQAITEEELEKGVKHCNAKGGWAVMMDPYTGEIFALAEYPFFYPSRYPEYFNDKEKMEYTKVHAITDANEPGSTMKPITTAVALLANQELQRRGELPLFDPEEMMDCLDGHFPGRQRVLREVRVHKYLNLNMATQKSANVYFARLIQRVIDRLGNAWYRKTLQEVFGFGTYTNIELAGESPGLLPRPGKMHPNGALEWSVSTPFSMAIGHNLQVNSLQMLRAFAMLANGGKVVRPTLLQQKEPLEERQVLDPKIAARVVESIKYVTKFTGSGRRADILGFTEAGKTGTANKIVGGVYSKAKTVASFIGFAPVVNPRFVLIVVMDEPENRFIPGVGNNVNGSVSAAPVFKEVAKRTLEYLGVTPDDPYGYPVGDPRYNKELADWKKETDQLQEIYKKWNN